MNVFFYGLFMDEQLLAEKGITAKNAAAVLRTSRLLPL